MYVLKCEINQEKSPECGTTALGAVSHATSRSVRLREGTGNGSYVRRSVLVTPLAAAPKSTGDKDCSRSCQSHFRTSGAATSRIYEALRDNFEAHLIRIGYMDVSTLARRYGLRAVNVLARGQVRNRHHVMVIAPLSRGTAAYACYPLTINYCFIRRTHDDSVNVV